MLDAPRDVAVQARIDALSAIYAAWAQHGTEVEAFRGRALRRQDPAAVKAWAARGPHPGYELLNEDDVPAWVLERHNAVSQTGDGDEYVMALIRQHEPRTESEVVHLPFIDRGRPRLVTVPRVGTLGDLAALSEKIADWYRWHPAWACLFVLTGAQPTVSAFTASAQVRYGMDGAATTRVTLTLDPTLPPRVVADLYAGLRSRLQHERQPPRRAQSLRFYRLAEHVGPHVRRYPANSLEVERRGRPRSTNPPGGIVYYIDPVGCTWQDLRHSWNERYPAVGEDGKPWRYDRLSNFTRDAQDALYRLLDPGWRLPPDKDAAGAE